VREAIGAPHRQRAGRPEPLLFKSSPLRPAGSSDNAESAYRFGGPALYAESVDVYDKPLNAHEVVSNGYSAVSQWLAEAVGVSSLGAYKLATQFLRYNR